jgi:hypothetical protein
MNEENPKESLNTTLHGKLQEGDGDQAGNNRLG